MVFRERVTDGIRVIKLKYIFVRLVMKQKKGKEGKRIDLKKCFSEGKKIGRY